MRGANRDHEKERNLHVDLPRGKHNPKPIPKFDQIPFKDEKFSKKICINWLTKVKAYFYFNKIVCSKKVWLVVHKISCGAREQRYEVLEYRTRPGKPLTPSQKDLKQSLIIEFIQDDYKEILYWINKQINCYYFNLLKQLEKKICRSLQNKQFQHHLDDNNITAANTILLINVSFTNGKEEIKETLKLISFSDSQGLEALKEKLEQVIGIAQEAKVDIKKDF